MIIINCVEKKHKLFFNHYINMNPTIIFGVIIVLFGLYILINDVMIKKHIPLHRSVILAILVIIFMLKFII